MLRQLVGLHQPLLQFGAVGDVVENDQPADLLLVLRDQRRDRDVQRRFAEQRRRTVPVAWPLPLPLPFTAAPRQRRLQHELVDVVDAGFAAHAVELVGQLVGEQFATACVPSACSRVIPLSCSICVFQLSTRSSRSAARIPTLIDSTMFSLNSLSRSYSSTLRCSDR